MYCQSWNKIKDKIMLMLFMAQHYWILKSNWSVGYNDFLITAALAVVTAVIETTGLH